MTMRHVPPQHVPLPKMPVGELVELICADGSDYLDGDDPGYARGYWDSDTGELVLDYEPDLSADLDEKFKPRYGWTTRRFRPSDEPSGTSGSSAGG
jgi:hypothetical protein